MLKYLTQSRWKLILPVAAFAPGAALGVDIEGVQPAALDQPRVNAYVTRTAGGVPLSFENSFNIQAFYDTGASGVLISNETADLLEIQRHEVSGTPVLFSDVGVGGTSDFNVSEQLFISLAPYHPDADVDDIGTYESVYTQTFGALRTQIGPVPPPTDFLLQNLDVFGMPTMTGKVVVMDPKPVDTFLDTMRTYVYNPGTPFNSGQADTDPGIPATSHQVQLSYASFERFTTITPSGADGPTLRNNPFVGPNPVTALDPNPPVDNTPPVVVGFDGVTATGSFLLDTGAAASIISNDLAAKVHVRYVAGTDGTDDPELEVFDPLNPGNPGTVIPDQFQLTIGGIGGTARHAGFFLDSMLLSTLTGVPMDPNDPNNLNFIGAPVLVFDISVMDPITSDSLTLDGILGMNFLVATAFLSESSVPGEFPIIDNLTEGAFDWLVFDEPNGLLNLQLKGAAIPEPTGLLPLALSGLLMYRRRRRQT